MGIKRSQADINFSRAIRQRDNWTCRHCCTPHGENDSNLHCAHIYGRAIKATRWHPDNAIALCATCHHWYTDRPAEFHTWLLHELGEDYMDALRELSNGIGKDDKNHKLRVSSHYLQQYRALRDGTITDLQPLEVPC